MLAGITGSRAAAALVVLGPLTQAFDWFPGLSDWLLARFDPQAVAPTTPAAFLAAAVAAVVVWLGLAAGSSVVTDYGFTLARVGDDLVVRRGLLERRRRSSPWPGCRWSGSTSRCCAGPSAWPRSASRAPAGREAATRRPAAWPSRSSSAPRSTGSSASCCRERRRPGLRVPPRRPAAGR